jgi:uncharacterized coiled-coil protein SlyX
MNSANGAYSYAVGAYAQVSDDYAAAFGFSGETCYSMGDSTVNLCTEYEGLYHNGVKLNSIASSNVNSDSVTSVIAGGSDNTIDGTYSVVGGGQKNYVKARYASIGGGYGANIRSNYGAVSGGFLGKVTGRFGTAVGGSRNTAMGRYSLAAGYRAEAGEDYSVSLGFSGLICTGRIDYDINICATTMMINDIDLTSLISRRRELEARGTDEAADELLKTLAEQEKTLSEMTKRDAEQDAISQEQSKTLAHLKGRLSELLAMGAST